MWKKLSFHQYDGEVVPLGKLTFDSYEQRFTWY